MTHVPPNRRRWTDDWDWSKPTAPKPDATETNPKVRKLYGPKGQVLRTFSDRPPVGFHQGERNA